MSGTNGKRVIIQSDFPEKNHIENVGCEQKEGDAITSKYTRPKLPKERRRVERIRMYCNQEEKERLYRHFGGSDKMRDVLLSLEKGELVLNYNNNGGQNE